MKRFFLQIVFCFLFVINISFAGFDLGGGPGMLASSVLEFLGNNHDKALFWTSVEEYNDDMVRLSSPLKAGMPDEVNVNDEFIKGFVHQNNVKFLVAIITLDGREIDQLVFAFLGEIRVGGEYIFDLKNSVNVYRLDLDAKKDKDKLKELEMGFKNYIDGFRHNDVKPDINFIVPSNKD